MVYFRVNLEPRQSISKKHWTTLDSSPLEVYFKVSEYDPPQGVPPGITTSTKSLFHKLVSKPFFSERLPMYKLRVRFFKKIRHWIFKSERIRKWSLCFFTKQINPKSPGSWCGRNRRIHFQSGFFGSFDAPWSQQSWIDLSSKETQNLFSDSFGFKNPNSDFLKETHSKSCEFWILHLSAF